ncbi:uncharacterized protein IUM83_10764 [Phytophthora cinnamomi]|uniref:uncharacterized protein n=1 Tax=Phytophthora cinnamomi TaxID=4785 RepID=UPI00355997AB|nr:hypothetical protein IUM83_10764 [Phytophthora cinnamomi]
MRIVPVRNEAKLPSEPLAVAPEVPVANGQIDSRVSSAQDPQSEHLYELQLAQPLPSFDLSKTLVSKMLPSNAHNRLNLAMHRFLNSFLVWLFRFSLLCFGCLLFVPTKISMPVIPFMVAATVLPPVIFVTFFSLDVLVLLAYHYEFWFISTLNTLNWVALAAVSSETIITRFSRCFLGADDQLSLTTHSIYGEAFVAVLAEHRAVASTNDGVVVEAENSSESEDGDSFIDVIGEADL